MAQIASWNGHTFVVSPALIRGISDLKIKGSCETTDKNSEKQKYVEHKYGEIPEISMTVGLNALAGVTDVYGEAMGFVREATDGECAYFYLGTSKLLPAKMMLISAEVGKIVTMPGQGNQWISCDVSLKFKQGSKNDGSGNDSGDVSGNKASVKGTSIKDQLTSLKEKGVKADLNKVKALMEGAKAFSKDSKGYSSAGLQAQIDLINAGVKKTTTSTKSSAKVSATTGRSCEITLKKITLVPTSPKMTSILTR